MIPLSIAIPIQPRTYVTLCGSAIRETPSLRNLVHLEKRLVVLNWHGAREIPDFVFRRDTLQFVDREQRKTPLSGCWVRRPRLYRCYTDVYRRSNTRQSGYQPQERG